MLIIVTILSDNLRKHIEINNLSLRDLGKELGLSHSAISRILNSSDPENLHPKTKRSIANGLGFDFDALCTNSVDVLTRQDQNSYRIPFVTLNGESTLNTIESNEKHQFAINIQTNEYEPLFPIDTVLFFNNENAYQKDICIAKHNKNRILCIVIESYRNHLIVKNLATDNQVEIPRKSLIAVLMKSLHN